MFKNKHVIIAMIVAPVLAILAWFAVGQFMGEKPRAAKPGQSYPLVEHSNCRWESGSCDLANEDFQLRLSLQETAGGPEFVLTASHSLDGVVLGVAASGVAAQPEPMRAVDGQGLEWRMALDSTPGPADRIRLVAKADGASYFAEASTAFLQPGS